MKLNKEEASNFLDELLTSYNDEKTPILTTSRGEVRFDTAPDPNIDNDVVRYNPNKDGSIFEAYYHRKGRTVSKEQEARAQDSKDAGIDLKKVKGRILSIKKGVDGPLLLCYNEYRTAATGEVAFTYLRADCIDTLSINEFLPVTK